MFLGEIVFGFTSDNYLHLELSENVKRTVIKIILVQGFCRLKTEIARFSIGFRLNVNCMCKDSLH